ncbi:MAG TPA: histone deacetylase family protein [Terriglobales bacterium]|nr:histone deacetylase family protein [Terriglobales bacterium]
MKIITDEHCTGYSYPGHPERPERISATLTRLKQQKEIDLQWVTPSAAPDEPLLRAHTPEHLKRLVEPTDFDADTPFLPQIINFARLSAGASLLALQTAKKGETVFSLMRPPGHHATRTRAMGFCYLSNIAIAALEALATGTKKIGIFDFDVHHGNGTEAILLNNPGTIFCSIHQSPCYPGTGTRNVGNNCFNYPVPPQTARREYRNVLESALEHMVSARPEIIGVSAGFDCYARDPLAQETLEAEDFYWLGQRLRALGLPLFSVLEGGYSHDLPDLILSYLKGIAGK